MPLKEYVFSENHFPEETMSDLISILKNYPVVLFDAPMASGKTTLISAIVRHLGVTEEIQSPTYTLVNEYSLQNSHFPYDAIAHMDLYRLQSTEEALQAGIEEYFYKNYWCFVEWPEIIGPVLPEKHLLITIEILEDNTRKIVLH